MIKNKVVICTSNEEFHAHYRTLLNESGLKTLFISKTSELETVELSSRVVAFIIDLDGVYGHQHELLHWYQTNPYPAKIIAVVPINTPKSEISEMMRHGIEVITSSGDQEIILQLIGATGHKFTHAELIHQKAIEGLLSSKSLAMQKILNVMQKIKSTNASVLLFGETGTGKEVVARRIHQQSQRIGRFIAINCPAIPAGLAESELFGHEKGAFTGAVAKRSGKILMADHGTVFLDEIGDLTLEVQAKLLRVLQERELETLGGRNSIPLNIRLIAATSRDLKKMISEGRFREDLYYRLCDLEIRIPPLRERLDDIADLVTFFTNEFAAETNSQSVQFSEEDVAKFKRYSWPGNIRELRGVVRRIIMMSTDSEADARIVDEEFANKLNPPIPQILPTASLSIEPLSRLQTEKTLIIQTLEAQGHNISKTAKVLGIGRTTIYRKMKKFDIAS